MKIYIKIIKWKYFVLGMAVTAGLSLVVGILAFGVNYNERVLPGVQVAGIKLKGLKLKEVEVALNQDVDIFWGKGWPMKLWYGDKEWWLANPGQEWVRLEVSKSAKLAMDQYRTQGLDGWIKSFRVYLLNDQINLPYEVVVSEDWLNEVVATISGEVSKPMVPPRIEINKNNTIEIVRGEDGYQVENEKLKDLIVNQIETTQEESIKIPIKIERLDMTTENYEQTKIRAENILAKELIIRFNDQGRSRDWVLGGVDLIAFMDFFGGYDRDLINDYLNGVKESIDRSPQNAKFKFNEANRRVEEFVPALNGIELGVDEATGRMIRALTLLESNETAEPVILPVNEVEPDVNLSDVNDLGIKELIGRGESTYFGSILTRVHNVALAAARLSGVIVPPGEEFSFNKAVGEVSRATGYQSAYVIANGRTVLGDGGGVCQDSTTVFRAALDAGLPISERRAHSYRVGYYEQNTKAGIDATVYAPTTDFKFLNDTPNYILIQAKADSENRKLVVEIYGTNDGRKSEIINHQVWGSTPPPPDIYQEDPTLPLGTIKQVDWKAWGARAKFDYVVKRGNSVIYEKTFYSTYKAWPAVFLTGTGQ